MAKLFGISGLATGKKGDNVFVVRNGCQIIRQYVPHINDPKTPAQLAVRAKTKLMSQLSVVYAPILAMKRKKMCSPRMRFIEKNYDICDYEDGKASVSIHHLQLTEGFRYVPHFIVDRSNHSSILVQLLQDARSYLAAVMYVVVSVDGEGRIMLQESYLQAEAGDDGLFSATLKYQAQAVAVYAYGLYGFDGSDDIVDYLNINGNAAAGVADLVVLRSPLMRNVYFSQTKGCFLEAGDETATSDRDNHVYIRVRAPQYIDVSGAGRYEYGDEVVIYTEVPNGWTFDGYYINGVRQEYVDALVFTATKSLTVEVRMTVDPVLHTVLNVYPVGAGTATGGGDGAYLDEVSVRATPAEGKVFDYWGWLLDSQAHTFYKVSEDNPYNFVLFQNQNLYAVFKDAPLPTYTVNVEYSSASQGVGTALQGDGEYQQGQTCELNVVFDTNQYEFVGWFDHDNDDDPANADYTHTPFSFTVNEDVRYYCVLKEKKTTAVVTASINDPDHGSVTGAGTYNIGDTVTLRMSADSGYVVFGFSVNGRRVAMGSEYTFVVTDDVTVECWMGVSGQRWVCLTVVGDDDAVVTGSGVYNQNDQITVSVTPSRQVASCQLLSQYLQLSNLVSGDTATAGVWSGIYYAVVPAPSEDENCVMFVAALDNSVTPRNYFVEHRKNVAVTINQSASGGLGCVGGYYFVAGAAGRVSLSGGMPKNLTVGDNAVFASEWDYD